MKKDVISIFDEKADRNSTSAERIGKSIFWILTIPIILFVLITLVVYFVLVNCGRSCV